MRPYSVEHSVADAGMPILCFCGPEVPNAEHADRRGQPNLIPAQSGCIAPTQLLTPARLTALGRMPYSIAQ